jgi:hypothetical protein
MVSADIDLPGYPLLLPLEGGGAGVSGDMSPARGTAKACKPLSRPSDGDGFL